MRIPLFIFYSTFSYACHTNPKLAILRDFPEVCNLKIKNVKFSGYCIYDYKHIGRFSNLY